MQGVVQRVLEQTPDVGAHIAERDASRPGRRACVLGELRKSLRLPVELAATTASTSASPYATAAASAKPGSTGGSTGSFPVSASFTP